MRNIDKAMEVHEILTQYIEIHNDLFKKSMRRVIPIPGIFQSIDYGKNKENLADLAERLRRIISDIDGNNDFSNDLREYVKAFYQTISSLLQICEKLYAKSQGDLNSYPKTQYEEDLAEYHSYERSYQGLGNQLNRHLT